MGKAELNLKKYFSILIVCCIVSAIFLYVSTNDTASGPKIYQPIIHSDGSTEVRLIYIGGDRTRGTTDDQHWVLNFPAGLKVYTPQPAIAADSGLAQIPQYSANTIARFALEFPDFSYVDEPVPTLSENRIIVTASELRDTWADPISALSLDPRDHLPNYIRTIENCQMAVEVAPSVLKLVRSGSDQARDAKPLTDLILPTDFVLPAGCAISGNDDRSQYMVLDDHSRPIGLGECELSTLDGYTDNDDCRFKIWLPIERSASIRFRAANLEQANRMLSHISDLLLTVTDFNRSINLTGGAASNG